MAVTRPSGLTRSTRALSRSVTSASPPGRKAIAHGTARFRASTAGSPMWAVGFTAPSGAGALRPDGEPPSAPQAPHASPAHTAIAAITRERMSSPQAGQAIPRPHHHHPPSRRGAPRSRRGADPGTGRVLYTPCTPSASGLHMAGLSCDRRQRLHGTEMTSPRTGTPRAQALVSVPPACRKGSLLASWLSSTDHKIIGHLYLITSFGFFLIAGLMAMIIRAQLTGPDNHVVSDQQYNQLFTMHGTIMLLLFATPLFVGFANEIMPLQIGSPDVAFPRLNILSYYFFLFGGLILLISFLTPGGAAAFGWYAYAPLTSQANSPGIGGDLWIMGLTLSGLGSILSAVNFVTTIICLRAPGMTMFRLPIFTWNILLTSLMVLIAFPVLAAALLVLEIDRKLGSQVFSGFSGG